MTVATFEQDEIRFQYPENWTLASETGEEGVVSVSLQSPENSCFFLERYNEQLDLVELAHQMKEEMANEYKDLEFEADENNEELFGHSVTGYDLRFYCLDFLVLARLACLHVEDKTIVIMWQAESRLFEKNELVYQAITKSLLTS
ncbi:MAG: hypothetical protein MPJ24_09930 [Pirellulaceae bacterium]|nr:hypothetical protein [Pirellulaceae bacterium]